MKCKECQLCMKNKDGIALCTFNASWEPTLLENECPLDKEIKPLTCGDCIGFYNDTACMGCSKDDTCPQEGCTMNPFKFEEEIVNFLDRLEASGINSEEYMKKVLTAYKEFKEKKGARQKNC